MNDREFILELSELYRDKRSDIVDIINEYLKTGNIDRLIAERRYVRARIPVLGIEIEYDTYTTLLQYHIPLAQWQDCEHHEYYNNDEEREDRL